MKLLVTGGCGFIGSNFVNNFSDEFDIVVIDDFSSGKLENVVPHKNIRIIPGNIADEKFMENLFQLFKFEGIVHLAAIASVQKCQEEPLSSQDVNYRASIHLMELALKYNVRKFVFASSAAVYNSSTFEKKSEEASLTSPISFYGIHKYAAERSLMVYSKLTELEGTAFRFFNVYGPNQDPNSPYSGVLSIFMEKVINSLYPEIRIFGTGEQCRDFIHVSDVVNGIKLALTTSKLNGQVYNLGTGKETTLLEIVEMLEMISGKKINVSFQQSRPGDILKSCSENAKVISAGHRINVPLLLGLQNLYDHLSITLEKTDDQLKSAIY